MPRVRKGAARHKAKKRVLKAVKGYRGARGRLYRIAKESSIKALANARTDRKRRKREFRRLWILRLNAACKQRDLRYSQFINGCKKANIQINRKMLSEIAISDSAGFDAIVEAVKTALN